jgi:23S rRNA A1618 N6-methylase RlmF
VPDKLIDEMMRRSSKEIYWLDSLEGADDLDQRAPWFEELMISKCGFDPAFDRQVNSLGGAEIITGKKISKEKKERYFAWRQNYNTCEYAFRRTSQAKFISGK